MKQLALGALGMTMLSAVPVLAQASSYSASRSNGVKLIWRKSMGKHTYYTFSGARYSHHLGYRWNYMKRNPNTTWYTNMHEKVQVKSTGNYRIYYHVVSGNGKHGGWIWRGYLKSGHNPYSTASENAAKKYIALKESGNSYTAVNGLYYGKYQLTKSYLGGDLSAANQEYVANMYVASRYGTWVKAKTFWQGHGYF